MGLTAFLVGASVRADEPWQAPAVAAAGLPRMQHVGVVLDPATLKYNPCNDAIFPSVIKTETLQKPLGKYYMYYAPHNAPGGICLAYADKLEGPWKEYAANPIISREWAPHYKVDHVSGPHAIWIEEERKLFVYYHGDNAVTRYASTTDGIHFTYEGEAVNRLMFDQAGECSYARVHRYTIPGKDNRYIMLVMGTHPGGRKLFLAWSRDGRKWETRREPFLASHNTTAYYGVAAGWLLPWNDKLYIIYHDYDYYTDLHACEVDARFEKLTYLGLFYPHDAAGTNQVAQMSHCFIEEEGKLYMFSNTGPRLKQEISLAIAPVHPPVDEARLARQKAAAACFGDWPEGKAPEAVGHRLVREFLARNISLARHPSYPEVITWNGALMLTRLTRNWELNEQLIRKFDCLAKPPGDKYLSQEAHVDIRMFGSLPLELFLQTRLWRYQLTGTRFADAQWQNPTADGITGEARYWVDDLYMIGILQSQAWRATGNPVYLDRCGRTARAYLAKLQQPAGLFFHAADTPFYWGRGNGWFAAGLTEILRVLPESHPDRPVILDGYRKMMKALLAHQGANGLWKQLVDKPESWDETSGSGMFAYAMVTGVKEGWLDAATYGPAARKAWLALVDCIDASGRVRDVCAGTFTAATMVGADVEKQHAYYLERPRSTGDFHGQAPILWTACALLR